MSVIALAGNPNCGKTTLFNALTGLNQQVGNYPGVTVERRLGRAKLGETTHAVIDLPGTYSLIARSRDEAIAFEVLTGRASDPRPDLAVLVLDASNLDRNLYLALSILELGLPAVVALNMMDLAKANGLAVDPEALARSLGVPVVPIVARTGEGLEALRAAITAALLRPAGPHARSWRADSGDEDAIRQVEAIVARQTGQGLSAEGQAIWLLSSLAASQESHEALGESGALFGDALPLARKLVAERPHHLGARIIQARFDAARDLAEGAVTRATARPKSATDRLDALLLHPLAGLAIYVVVMALLFQSIFSWAEPLMDGLEGLVKTFQGSLAGALPEGALRDLLVQGAVGGAGNVLVFIPQIAILFAFIALLEDSGYLARAAFISDRLMARIGLHGRAFVPLLSGFACAIPAVMATRAIESSKDRLVTILVAPLVSCSARLPIYTLIIAALFASDQKVFGFLSLGAVMMMAMYLLSITVTVLVAFVLKRTVLKSPTPPLVLELPPYRMPQLGSVLRRVVERCKVFVRDAGTVILACSIVLWALLYFPRDPQLSFEPEKEKASIAMALKASVIRERDPARVEERRQAAEAALQRIDERARAERLQQSFGGRLGKGIEPLIAPLGFDWKIGIGLLGSFAAREVFISTMGLVYGVGDDVDEENESLREQLRKGYPPLVGLALMVFFVLAAQCMSTMAVVRRETNSWRWPAFMIAYMTALAWIGAFLTYQGGRLLGFG